MPAKERAVLVYAGHISNDLAWLSKMMFAAQATGNDIKDSFKVVEDIRRQALMAGTSSNVLILTRMYAGKLNEAIEFLDRRVFRKGWFEEILPGLPPVAMEARKHLEEYIKKNRAEPKKDILKTVRDKYAFHYDKALVDDCKTLWNAELEFDSYLADQVGNTLYFGSERVILEQLREIAGFDDAPAFFSYLFEECLMVGGWVRDLLGYLLAELYCRRVGSSIESIGLDETFEVEAPPLRSNRLPYFFSHR